MHPHKEHIGILGGSFNPVHIGHIILADFIVQRTNISQVWLMLSPLNPLKANPEELISDSHRLEMLRIATKGNPRLLPCDIELSMPQPSYSINSLNRLQELHPDKQFSLIIGSDNWLMFDRWRSYEEIIKNFSPIVYPRPGYNIGIHTLPQNVTLVNAPTLDISSTFIRDSIAMGFDMQNFLPKGVAEYINQNGLYR